MDESIRCQALVFILHEKLSVHFLHYFNLNFFTLILSQMLQNGQTYFENLAVWTP